MPLSSQRRSLLSVVALVVAIVLSGAKSSAQPLALTSDVTGDGLAETLSVSVGGTSPSPSNGSVVVRSGADNSVVTTLLGPQPGEWFGHTAGFAPNIGAGGIIGLVISLPRGNPVDASEGRVVVCDPLTGGLIYELPRQPFTRLGLAVSTIADQDGDGRADLLVQGAERNFDAQTWESRTFVYSGRTGKFLASRTQSIASILAAVQGGVAAYRASDMDDSGRTDTYDLVEIAILKGTSPGPFERGDLDGNGVVNQADLAIAIADYSGGIITIAGYSGGLAEGETVEYATLFQTVYGEPPAQPLGPGEVPPETCACTSGLRTCAGYNVSILNCPTQPVRVGDIVSLATSGGFGDQCSWIITSGNGLVQPGHWSSPSTFVAVGAGCVTVRMECSQGGCCACTECSFCIADANECVQPTVYIEQCRGVPQLAVSAGGSLELRARAKPQGCSYTWWVEPIDPTPPAAIAGLDWVGPQATFRAGLVSGLVRVHVLYECAPNCLAEDSCIIEVLADADMDGLPDSQDPCPANPDCDGDTWLDGCEVKTGFDPLDANSHPNGFTDTDDDGLSDTEEICKTNTNPAKIDTDGDGVTDFAEVQLGLNPNRTWSGGAEPVGVPGPIWYFGDWGTYGSLHRDCNHPLFVANDVDRDWAYDEWEKTHGLDPMNRDMDGDGIPDGVEHLVGSNPLANLHRESPDSDGDGLCDWEESSIYHTNPGYYDSDFDGLSDGFEVKAGLDPLNPYSDGHWVTSISGGLEFVGTHDLLGDIDGDGLSNADEFAEGTDPRNPDTDGDGVLDGIEVAQGTNPRDIGDQGLAPTDYCEVTVCIGPVDPLPDKNCEVYSLHAGPVSIWTMHLQTPICRTRRVPKGECLDITMANHGRLPGCAVHYNYFASVTTTCCSVLDDPGDLLGRHGYSNEDRTVGLRATRCMPKIVPDPATHLDPSALTILPGDTEKVFPSGFLPGTQLTISDSTIAAFVVDGELRSSVTTTSTGSFVVRGLRRGSTAISFDDPPCEGLPVHVGGEVTVEYDRPATFKAEAATGAPPTQLSETFGGHVPDATTATNIAVGGNRVFGAGGRLPLSAEMFSLANQGAEVKSTLTVRIRDYQGTPKPNKEVLFTSRLGFFYDNGPGGSPTAKVVRTTNLNTTHPLDSGKVVFTVRANAAAILNRVENLPSIPTGSVLGAFVSQEALNAGNVTLPWRKQEWGLDKDQGMLLFGEGARKFFESTLTKDTVDGELDDHARKYHFPGHSFEGKYLKYTSRFEQPDGTPPAELEFSFTMCALDMLAVNHAQYNIVLKSFGKDVYTRVYPGSTGSSTLLDIWDSDPSLPVPVWLESLNQMGAEPLGGMSDLFQVTTDQNGDRMVHGGLLRSALIPELRDKLGPYYEDHPLGHTLTIGEAWNNFHSEYGLVIDIGAVILEFGLGFIPGYDIVDCIKEFAWKPIVNGDQDGWGYATGAAAFAGLLADAGYLAGPAGFVSNGVTSAVKAIIKKCPRALIKAIFRSKRTVRESMTMLVEYLARFPKPENFDSTDVAQVSAWVKDLLVANLEAWNKFLHSPLKMGAEDLAPALAKAHAITAVRSLTGEGLQGVGVLLREGGASVEQVLDAAAAKIRTAAGTAPASAELADRSINSVAEASSLTCKRNPDALGSPDQKDFQRTTEALEAAGRAYDSRLRGFVTPHVGPNKPFKTMEEFEALRFHPGEALTDEQKTAFNAIRQAIGMPGSGDTVAKVIPLDTQFTDQGVAIPSAMDMLTDGLATIGGDVTRAADLAGASTSAQVINRLRLDYAGSPYASTLPYAVLETPASTLLPNMKIPRSPGFGGEGGNFMRDTKPYPRTGNGLTASVDGHITPEWRMTTPSLMQADNTILSFKHADGSPRQVSLGGAGSSDRWLLRPNPGSPTGFVWEPAP